jgi:hypothetical protein
VGHFSDGNGNTRVRGSIAALANGKRQIDGSVAKWQLTRAGVAKQIRTGGCVNRAEREENHTRWLGHLPAADFGLSNRPWESRFKANPLDFFAGLCFQHVLIAPFAHSQRSSLIKPPLPLLPHPYRRTHSHSPYLATHTQAYFKI